MKTLLVTRNDTRCRRNSVQKPLGRLRPWRKSQMSGYIINQLHCILYSCMIMVNTLLTIMYIDVFFPWAQTIHDFRFQSVLYLTQSLSYWFFSLIFRFLCISRQSLDSLGPSNTGWRNVAKPVSEALCQTKTSFIASVDKFERSHLALGIHPKRYRNRYLGYYWQFFVVRTVRPPTLLNGLTTNDRSQKYIGLPPPKKGPTKEMGWGGVEGVGYLVACMFFDFFWGGGGKPTKQLQSRHKLKLSNGKARCHQNFVTWHDRNY